MSHKNRHGVKIKINERKYAENLVSRNKKGKKWTLGLPFLYEVLRYLAAVAWTNLDFPAAEFFDFAADT
jgi:hypothetical protein